MRPVPFNQLAFTLYSLWQLATMRHLLKEFVCVLLFQRGALPIHHAAMRGYPDIMKMLISAGSKIDIPDKVECKNIALIEKHSHFN